MVSSWAFSTGTEMLQFPEADKDSGTSVWEPEAHREPAKRPD